VDARPRDRRSPATRRADALLEVIGRGVASPGAVPRTEKAQVVVTIPVQALLDELTANHGTAQKTAEKTAQNVGQGAGHAGQNAHPTRLCRNAGQGAGLTDGGQVLSAATARRLACDGGIIPMVLGADGAVLDLGRTQRLFTAAQRRAIIHRDGGCTFPGCTVPAGWCEAHHITWWSRGGRTDLRNGALLCQRHHTLVHHRDLTATVTATRVTWHE
jgi:hypothetical protein